MNETNDSLWLTTNTFASDPGLAQNSPPAPPSPQTRRCHQLCGQSGGIFSMASITDPKTEGSSTMTITIMSSHHVMSCHVRWIHDSTTQRHGKKARCKPLSVESSRSSRQVKPRYGKGSVCEGQLVLLLQKIHEFARWCYTCWKNDWGHLFLVYSWARAGQHHGDSLNACQSKK